MPERWLPVLGFEGIYEVSDLGRVKRVRGGSGATPGRILPHYLSKHGQYHAVDLSDRNRRKRPLVHKLVAHAFIGPRPLGLEIDHIDGNKDNNCVDNLEYVTRKQNVSRAVAMNLVAYGERQGRAKVDEDDVRHIRKLIRRGAPVGLVALLYGVSIGNAYDIAKGRTWRRSFQCQSQ